MDRPVSPSWREVDDNTAVTHGVARHRVPAVPHRCRHVVLAGGSLSQDRTVHWSSRWATTADEAARRGVVEGGPPRVGATSRFQATARSSLAQAGERCYIDWKGVKRRTSLSAIFALSSALGSPTSSPETEPVARIASIRSPRCAVCSMSASESLYRSWTMHSDW